MKPHIDEHQTFGRYRKRNRTDYIIVHCAASQNKQEFDWKFIDRVHRSNGWLGIGYHFIIRTDGTIQNGRGIDDLGSHVAGYNDCSIGICLIGGLTKNGKPTNNFTAHQLSSLKELIEWLKEDHYPDAKVIGHCDVPGVNKACPCFNVEEWYNGFVSVPDPAPIPDPDVHVYTVAAGDTLYGISRKTDVTVQELIDINGLQNPDVIHPGQLLKLRR